MLDVLHCLVTNRLDVNATIFSDGMMYENYQYHTYGIREVWTHIKRSML